MTRAGPTATGERHDGPGPASWSGLTWDHPRGFAPLRALDGPVRWERQPLEGFESHPIDDLADRFDLLVIDHPGIGAAADAGCLRPVDVILTPEDLTQRREGTVGASFDSYRYAGRQWALPIDAATQVLAVRPDLLDGPLPTTWPEVLERSRRVPTALPLAGPHALLAFLAVCVALGAEPAAEPTVLVDRETGTRALSIVSELVSAADDRSPAWNPIDVLEAMAATDAVALCPLVYGYVTYAGPRSDGRRAVRFVDAPRGATDAPIGSVLGGTGIAVSRRTQITDELADYLRTLTSDAVQRDVIAANGGQPAARMAWRDPEVDAAASGFFSATLASVESAWVRPRYRGYIAFQDRGSELVRDAVAAGADPVRALERLDDHYRRSRHDGEEGP